MKMNPWCRTNILAILHAICIAIIFVSMPGSLYAQDAAETPKEKLSLFNFNTKAVDAVNKQYTKLQANVEKQSQKMLERMQRKEAKLKRKLQRTDSTKAAELFSTDVQQQYNALQQ